MHNFSRLVNLNLVLLPNSAFLPKVIKLGLGSLRVEIPLCNFPLFSLEQMAWFIPTEAFECVFRWDRHKASDEQIFVLATAL